MSGGLDSSVAAIYLRDVGFTIQPVFFKYGSNHNKWERSALIEFCNFHRLPDPIEIDISNAFLSTNPSTLMGGNVPFGHYNEETMKSTVVPGRNMIFISILMYLLF